MSDISRTRLRQWTGNILAVCLGFAAVGILLATAEAVLRFKVYLTTAPKDIPVAGKLDGALSHATILGVEGKPNSEIRCRAARDGRVLYDTICRTDSAGRRLTPCDASAESSNLAVFFGCSMTFGLGVEDGDTLPALYADHATNCCSLNYGVPGYGPQQMWLQICKQGVLKDFGPRKGIIVYSFIDDHINRLAGTPGIVSEWPYALPWIDLRNGHIEHRGTFFDRSPLQYLFLRHVSRTHLARFIENRIPHREQAPQPSDNAVDLLAAVVRECADTAAREAPGLKFYCLIFPKFFTSTWGKAVAGRLAGSGVNVLDYSDLFEDIPHAMDELCYEDNSLYRWGHPKALGYDLVARQMSQDISL